MPPTPCSRWCQGCAPRCARAASTPASSNPRRWATGSPSIPRRWTRSPSSARPGPGRGRWRPGTRRWRRGRCARPSPPGPALPCPTRPRAPAPPPPPRARAKRGGVGEAGTAGEAGKVDEAGRAGEGSEAGSGWRRGAAGPARSDAVRARPAPATGRPRGLAALTSFVGRDDDTSGVLKKLGEHRLVTLIGPGGVGKTRLATEVCARLATPAWFAELAPVTDPAQLPWALLSAVGVAERVIARQASGAGDPMSRLTDAIAGRDAVLVLDNCEHVIDAAAALAARVLQECPEVTILATSREPLRITGEVLCTVFPLAVPPADPPASANATATAPASNAKAAAPAL